MKPAVASRDQHHLVTVEVAGQSCGFAVAAVHDVLSAQRITPAPLAPSAVAGSINLRGRIVTVLDLRVPLGLPPAAGGRAKQMQIVVEHKGDLHSLLIDSIGDATHVPADLVEAPPQTLEPTWKSLASGVCRLPDRLLVLLDLDRLVAASQA